MSTIRGKKIPNHEDSKQKNMSEEDQMGYEWDERADKDTFHYILTNRQEWNAEDFFKTGEELAQRIIDPFMKESVTHWEGKVALDVGCGVGRVTRALSKRFKEVIGVDVSGRMIEIAKSLHKGFENMLFFQNNGRDFALVKDKSIDYVFSALTFQHMPSREVIDSNIKEISRVLADGGVYQIQFSILGGWTRLFRIIPFPRRLSSFVPSWLVTLYRYFHRCDDPLKRTETFRGASLTRKMIQTSFEKHGLEVHFQEDCRHPGGTLIWAVGCKKKSL